MDTQSSAAEALKDGAAYGGTLLAKLFAMRRKPAMIKAHLPAAQRSA